MVALFRDLEPYFVPEGLGHSPMAEHLERRVAWVHTPCGSGKDRLIAAFGA